MRQLHNQFIASPDDGGLVGAIHAITNDLISSDTMLHSLAPPKLRPMTYNHNWIMKNSNVLQSPITRDTLLIADADTKVKRREPKLLLECFMRQLHNELIASPDDRGLVGAIHAITDDVIISDTMLRSLAPPQLRPMTDNHKMMCGCGICNTSKYMQESLNAWLRKQL